MLISEHETKFPRDASRREVSNLWLYFTHVPGATRRLPTVSPPLFPRSFAILSLRQTRRSFLKQISRSAHFFCPFFFPSSSLLDRARPLSFLPSLSSFAREMIERKDFAGEGKKFVSKRIRQIPRGSLLENGGISG